MISELTKLKTRIAVLEGLDAAEDAEEVIEESSENSDPGRNHKSSSAAGTTFGER